MNRIRFVCDRWVFAFGLWLHFDPDDEVCLSLQLGPFAVEITIIQPPEEERENQ